jgi:6-phosphogluconate dehydrogenase (decarboxylating)
MSVVRRDARRRWAVVVTALAPLVAIPLVVRALPAAAATISADTLAARIAASARQPYQGYAVSVGNGADR